MQTAITLKRHFPEFEKMLSDLSDSRKRPHYEVQELAMAVITMFLNKRGSRNHADNSAGKLNYSKNIEQVFKMKLPDLDTADRLMKQLDPQEIEDIKQKMVSVLVSSKVLRKFRVLKFYYNVAIDGTGVHSYSYEPYPECPFKKYKSGIKVWTAQVLEAKIVCSNGFSISIATEWIKNPVDKKFDKQDCEHKAFVRLAAKIKKSFPRLPVCISADGLYPNNTVFDICENNNWKYIITLKDGNLKSVWEEIGFLDRINDNIKFEVPNIKSNKRIKEQYKAYKNIEYQKHELNIVDITIKSTLIKTEEKEPDKRFAHVTNFELFRQNIEEISHAGRLRWKIENEGFNEQKNGGYNLKHKYSRKSFTATQNYYQCLQIAHMINQLAYKVKVIKELIKGNDSLKSHKEMAVALLMVDDFENFAIITEQIINQTKQFRY
ncbi:MAG: hypothetical protein HQ536_00510 [Parcubacteria group bacterium]|nr:hypothetical protein [Parcubacteria group bacterium]